MDRDRSALLASWLTFGVSAVTLLVTLAGVVVGGIALLSIDQVKRVVCREFSYDCGFEGLAAHLLTVDVEPRKPGEGAPSYDLLPPPDLFDVPAPVPAWDLLVQEADPDAANDVARALSGSADRFPTECLPLALLNPLFNHADTTADLVGQRSQWKVTYVSDAIDAGFAGSAASLNPRSIGFELTGRYATLHRDVHLMVRMLAFETQFGAPGILPKATRDYPITLPAGSFAAVFVCALPDLPVGNYTVALESHGSEGDWEASLAPLELKVRAVKPPPKPDGPASR